MGYEKITTYILESELGTSLKASGWINEGEAGGKAWNSSGSRVRSNYEIDLFGIRQKAPEEKKYRWAKYLNKSDDFALTSQELIIDKLK